MNKNVHKLMSFYKDKLNHLLKNGLKGFNKKDIKCDDLYRKGIFGLIRFYYIRVEYQKRGSPHLHIILWLP